MDDPRGELAELVRDAQALLQALRLQGVVAVPPTSTIHPAWGEDEPLDAVAHAPATQSRAPRPAGPRAPHPAAPVPPPVAPALAPRRPVASPLSPPAVQGGGLLGKWAELRVSPADRWRAAVAEAPARCEGCGLARLEGVGGTTSGVVLLARGGGEAAEQMLANMLLKVVLVEPADCLRFAPRPCLACAESVARQVRALRPRVVLAMGADAATMIGQPPLGEWRRWAESDTVLSWHPEEIAADAARKRAAFVTLQEVARRR